MVSIQFTLQAKKAAEEASTKALEASKQAAGVSKTTLDDLTFVGKSTLGDLTKTAKEAAAKKGLMKKDMQSSDRMSSQSSESSVVSQGSNNLLAGTSRDIFSSLGSEINGLASSTTSMFSDLFGGNKGM